MFEIPFFQSDILTDIYKFNLTTLTSRLWVPWMVIVAAILFLCVFALRKQLKIKRDYSSVFDTEIYVFNRHSFKDWLGLSFLIAAFIATAFYMYMCENSFFETPDSMGLGTVRALKTGFVPSFDIYRVAPFAFWPLSTLYAITQNMYLIKLFVLAQLLIAVICLNAFFRFIPTSRRFVFLGMFLLTPTMFVTSKIIFPEREVLIALSLSLICLRRFCSDSKWRWLAGFLFFMNVAIYTKETSILFFGGVLAASILYHIWQETINLKSFFHPLKTISQMPLEFLIVVSLFLYSVIFFIMVDLSPETYYGNNSGDAIIELIQYYIFELVILFWAMILLLKRVFMFLNTRQNPMFKGGLVIGGGAVAVGIVFLLRLAPNTWFLAGKTYYLQLTVLFALSYLFNNITKTWILGILAAVVLFFSACMGWQNYQKEEGKYYRQVAEFLSENVAAKDDKILVVSLIERPDRITTEIWTIETWQLIYNYYSQRTPYSITIKPFANNRRRLLWHPSLYKQIRKELKNNSNPLAEADIVVIHKNNAYPETLKLINKLSSKPDFENKLFRAWKVEK